MARPIRETPVLTGEDAIRFEERRLEVENMSEEQRAKNRRELEKRVANAKNKIQFCFWFMKLIPLTLDYELGVFFDKMSL